MLFCGAILLNLMCCTKVTCLDVTPGGLAASCDTDGHLLVWTTENGEVRVCMCDVVFVFDLLLIDLLID